MPSERLDIYIIAIGGTGMAPLACLLQEKGHRVRGADGPLYPPMSTLLERAGIEPWVGFDASHLEPAPDLVVVGNAVRRDNPEAVAAESRRLPILSMPQALARFFLAGRRPLVVTGTHGKTTTTAMAAWVYSRCGRDPGYLIGGAPRDLAASFAVGSGDRFIVEGDEYNAAYFDRGAKFLHYQPETLILTSVEYDHADLYPDPAALRSAYAEVIAQLPPSGLLVACGDTPEVRELARRAPCPTLLYGLAPGNDVRPLPGNAGSDGSEGTARSDWSGGVDGIVALPEATRFNVADGEGGIIAIELQLAGGHNVANALAVWTAARHDGLPAAAVAAALGSFRGVERRLQEVGTAGGTLVVDDFAHHPTAVGKTLEALRQRYPDRRLVALFEPRSLTAGRTMFFDAYRQAFAGASRVLFAPTFHSGRLSPEERLDFGELAAALSRDGVAALCTAGIDELLAQAVTESRPGDVLVTMSSGAFGGLPRRLVEALTAVEPRSDRSAKPRSDESAKPCSDRSALNASVQ
jgi:UDP-N-acetylmuramate: L-alanyl-gamma-D-glutamyl-meso-diaminopimelate ligase